MARISMRRSGARLSVTLSGGVTAADLRRLERACGPALERQHIDLEIRLSPASTLDRTARSFVQRLVDRGALLIDSSGDSRHQRRQSGHFPSPAPRRPDDIP